jgi:hypothetical protein
MDARSEQQRRGGVAAVVKADVPDIGAIEQLDPGLVVGVLVERAAVRLGEDEIPVVPLGAGDQSLLVCAAR